MRIIIKQCYDNDSDDDGESDEMGEESSELKAKDQSTSGSRRRGACMSTLLTPWTAVYVR